MSCRSCPLDDPQSLWRNGWVLFKKSCKNLFPQPTLFQKKRLTTWSLKTLHQKAIQKKTFTMNYRDQSKRHPICRGKLLSAHQGGAGRRCYGATCLTWNRSIECRVLAEDLKIARKDNKAGCSYVNQFFIMLMTSPKSRKRAEQEHRDSTLSISKHKRRQNYPRQLSTFNFKYSIDHVPTTSAFWKKEDRHDHRAVPPW